MTGYTAYLHPSKITRGKIPDDIGGMASQLHKSFDTWEQAHDWIMQQATVDVRSAKKALVRAEETLRQVRDMKKGRG